MYETTDASSYVLYKRPVQADTQAIVRYLAWRGVDARPAAIHERAWPPEVTDLPAVRDAEGTLHLGIDAVARFFEKRTRVPDLLRKALEFGRRNPGYRVGDTAEEGPTDAVVRRPNTVVD